MPSTGTPRSYRAGSTCGAASAYTEAGPPERTSACGLRRRTSSGPMVCGTSSEYTRHSRTRRAISCEYWPPRAITRTGRSSGRATGSWTTSAADPVIRRLLRDRHVVRMGLAEPSAGNAHEARVLELGDRRRPAVAHRLADAPDQLVKDRREPPLVGDAPLDSLGDELVDVLHVALEVAVLRERAGAHRAERAHAAVLLVALALREDDLARRLVGAGEQRAEHHGVRAGRERLRNVARGGDAAVGDERDIHD